MPYLAKLAAMNPLVCVDRSTVYDCFITFVPEQTLVPRTAPQDSPRGDVSILHFERGEAFSVSRKIGKTPRSSNAYLEKRLKQPATTRAWNTVVRLVAKHL